MQVAANKMVAVDYKLTVDGQVADQSRPGQPADPDATDRPPGRLR